MSAAAGRRPWAVVIGRNEGERLRRCLHSLAGQVARVVYVDSDSSDGSAGLARELGAQVVELAACQPLTPGRARRAGLTAVLAQAPDTPFVQFVDGDCELEAGWVAAAASHLERQPGVAAVCGQLRERRPEASLMTRLLQLEWQGPPGEVGACGGNALYRVEALTAVGSFRGELVGGEEPELCHRLRKAGWRIAKLERPMALHDASHLGASAWLRRSVRAGRAYAHCAWLHGRSARPLWRRELRSLWVWGALLPGLGMAGALTLHPAWLALFAAYPVLVIRVYARLRARSWPKRDALLYALGCVLAKFPQALGALRFHVGHRSARGSEAVADGHPRVAYLVNQYPKTSHAFVRREILALETLGWRISRFTIRRAAEELPEAADRSELERTRGILAAGPRALAAAALAAALLHPLRFAAALALACRVGWRSDRGLARHGAYLVEACLLRRWLREEDCTHLHAHFGTNSAAVALLCRALGGPPYSFTVHGPEEFDKAPLLSLGEKVRRAAFAVAVSRFGRGQLLRWSPAACAERIHVVRCGLEPGYLAPEPVPDVARLVCVGRLSEQKGHRILLDAAQRLEAEGVEFELVLVGDGELRGEIERRARDLGHEGRVRLTGWADAKRVRDEIRAARGVVQPSLAEGLPVVLMEALALGRPVVSTYVAGIPELVEPGRSGWLVPAGCPDALARALRELLATPPPRLAQMAEAGCARVREFHDAEREAARLAGWFRDAIA